ncbi:glycosyltransferase family 39 protein [Patescibacteria group bacterium]|nr:glycosyltransferase family 39 protein [Patescibacteria group bacterium]
MILKFLQNKYFQLGLILFISSFIIFNNLGQATVFDWDEARYGVNALEIIKNDHWIALHYNGYPDLYNVRPPLGAWLIAMSFTIFGFSEFALRFWSALFAVLTVGLVYLIGINFANKKTAFFSSLVLLTSSQFINFGVARSADYNSGIIFFITLTNFLFLCGIKTNKKNYFLLTAVSLALGFLYKSIMGLIPLFLIVLFLLVTRNLKKYPLRDYIHSTILFLALVLPWLIVRYIAGRDFFVNMLKFDFYQRLMQGVEGNIGGLGYYFEVIYRGFSPWYILIVFALAFSIYYAYKKKSYFHTYLTIWILVIFIAMTAFQTKLPHYIALIYPAIALMIGSFFDKLYDIGKNRKYLYVVTTLLFLVFLYYGIIGINKVINQKIQPFLFVENIKTSKENFTQINNLYTDKILRQSELFYLESMVPGQILYCNYMDKCDLKAGDGLLFKDKNQKDQLSQIEELDLILEQPSFLLYKGL